MAVYKGLRRFDRSQVLSPGAGHAGHQSGMVDSIPLHQRNRPPSDRNTVRHHSGMLSAISPESCPSWPGLRSNKRNRHPGLGCFLHNSKLLIRRIPTTALDPGKHFDSISITRHSRMPRLTPSSSLCSYVRFKWGPLHPRKSPTAISMPQQGGWMRVGSCSNARSAGPQSQRSQELVGSNRSAIFYR